MSIAVAGSDFVVAEWSDDGSRGTDWIAPLHVHHEDDEAWYVLAGRLKVRLGDEIVEIGPGESVLAEKGTVHTYANGRAGETVRYLLTTTPRVMALIDALHVAEPGDAPATFAAFASELRES